MSARYEIDDNGRLYIDGELVPFVESPNQGGHMIPRAIVDHDTAGPSAESAVNWFAQSKSKVSAHFVVALDGSITQCVLCNRVAWHAGKSSWRGVGNLNGWSIGIEIDNPGKLTRAGRVCRSWWGGSYPVDECREMTTKSHGAGWWKPYPSDQISAVNKLHRALAARYPTITEVVGHYHISPGRKVDPNPLYEFAMARAAIKNVEPAVPSPPMLEHDVVHMAQMQLGELGYGAGPADGLIGPRTESAVFAFQKQNGLPATGDLDEITRLALATRSATKPMPNGARELTTEAEIIKTSRIAKSADGDRKEGAVMVGLAAASAGASQVKTVSDLLAEFVKTWGPSAVILAVSVGLLVYGVRRYGKGARVLWLRLTDHRSGRHIGGPVQ